MGTSRRQFVLASAVIAAAMILSGELAQAGYVSAAALADQDGVDALANPTALLLAEHETPSGAVGDTSSAQTDADNSYNPTQSSSTLLKLLRAARNVGHSGSGSSSRSAPGGSPSSPPVGDLVRPQIPPLQPISLLPPQTGDAHPFSVASFLFRPPRVA